MVDGFIYHTRVAVNTYSGREVLGRSDAGDPLPGTSAFGRQSAFFFFQLWFFFSPSKFYSHGWRARPVRHFLNPWTRAFFLYTSYAAFRWNSLAASILYAESIFASSIYPTSQILTQSRLSAGNHFEKFFSKVYAFRNNFFVSVVL